MLADAQETINAANRDMYRRVQPAAEAIRTAIQKVAPLLDNGTWSGNEAQKWISEWHARYNAVLRLLSELPDAEQKVVADVTKHAEKVSKQNRMHSH